MPVYYVGTIPYSSELYHHGIKGQKWGIRRYQNQDGTLTPAGRQRYGADSDNDKVNKKLINEVKRFDKAASKSEKKASNYFETSRKYKKLMEKARKATETADFFNSMRVKYNSETPEYRQSIQKGAKEARRMITGGVFMLGPIGGTIGTLAASGRNAGYRKLANDVSNGDKKKARFASTVLL